jgi:hypothetical protein
MMKVFQKKAIPIIVRHYQFICIVDEKPYEVLFRAYSRKYKTSFIEISFDWKECYYINLYRPLIKSILIEYCIKLGWIYDKPKQILRIKDSRKIVQELSLRDYDYK